MKIHGIAYSIIGLFVAVTSFYLFKGNQQFLFYIVGGALLSFGIVKMLIDRVREPKYEDSSKPKNQGQKHQPQAIYKPTQQMFERQAGQQNSNRVPPANQQVRYCPQCGTMVSVQQNFCHSCGAQLR